MADEAADGALIVKVWLQLSKEEQAARLRELEEDPDTAWLVAGRAAAACNAGANGADASNTPAAVAPASSPSAPGTSRAY